MGRIEDNRKKRKRERDSKDQDPLSEIGNRKIDTNKFDVDEETIKDQQNKK